MCGRDDRLWSVLAALGDDAGEHDPADAVGASEWYGRRGDQVGCLLKLFKALREMAN